MATFSQKFNTKYYEKRYGEKHIGACINEEKPFMLCKKELKELGYDVNRLPQWRYWTNSNGTYPLSRTVYFYDVRECVKKENKKQNK